MHYEYETAQDLANKIEWEGGIIEALEYGIRSSQIGDPELRHHWGVMENLWNAMSPVVSQIEVLLPDVEEA